MTTGDAQARERPGRRGGRTWRVAGALVAALAIGLCVRALVDQWPEVRHALVQARIGPIVVAFVLSAAAMAGLGLLWWQCLRLFGITVGSSRALAWYFGGELGKYLPGGVWTVLGRGELAHRDGRVSRPDAYATTLVSYATMCVAAGVVAGALSAAAVRGWGWALIALVPAGLLIVHPAVVGRLLRAGRRVTRGRIDLAAPSWPAMIRLVAWAAPTWLLVGGAAVAVTSSLGLDQHPARVAFAAVVAWIVGFLAVPVPAGAGVRELLFVGLCGLAAGPATAVAVVTRVLLVAVDGVGGAAGLVHVGRRRVRIP